MGTYLSWAAGVATSVELHRNVNNFDTGMAIFGKNLINSGKARPERVSFANAHESFKGGAKLALCPKKFGKKLARLGRARWAGLVLQRTSRGFDSPHDHLESCRKLAPRFS